MPFADKFRAMMDFPFPGDTLGGLIVESVEVSHHGGSAGVYCYDVRLVLRGPGGQQGVRRALAWFEADAARRIVDDEANTTWDRIIAAYESGLAQARD